MSVQVNTPFYLRGLIPERDLSRAELVLWEQTIRIIEQLYRRSGGGTDTGDDNKEEASANENQIAQLFGLLSDAESEIEALESDIQPVITPKEFRAVTKIVSYTAIDHDFINAKQNVTISLPANPPLNAIVIVRNGDGSLIKLNGNGRNINGSSTGKIRQEGTSLVIQYFIDSDEWLVR